MLGMKVMAKVRWTHVNSWTFSTNSLLWKLHKFSPTLKLLCPLTLKRHVITDYLLFISNFCICDAIFSPTGLHSSSNIIALSYLFICLFCLNTEQGIDNIYSIYKLHDGDQRAREKSLLRQQVKVVKGILYVIKLEKTL